MSLNPQTPAEELRASVASSVAEMKAIAAELATKYGDALDVLNAAATTAVNAVTFEELEFASTAFNLGAMALEKLSNLEPPTKPIQMRDLAHALAVHRQAMWAARELNDRGELIVEPELEEE